MSKIRTLNQLQEALDADMAWRIKDIAAFKLATRASDLSRRTFVRAGVAIVYAHWEGFIKRSSETYLNYVDNQGHAYRELKSCFAVFGLKGNLNQLVESKKSKASITAFDFIIEEINKPSKMLMSSAINTESNLTSKVFCNIALSLNISTQPYETKFNLIDESLVNRRNKIAHGEYLDLEVADFWNLSSEIIQMMRSYKIDLQNAASVQDYRC